MSSSIIKAYAEIPSIQEGIKALEFFSKELEDFNKQMNIDVGILSDTHKDQMFAHFKDNFDRFWPTLQKFVEKNNDYARHLEGRIVFIQTEYEKIKF